MSKPIGIRINPKGYITARDLIHYLEDNDLTLDTPLWPCVKLDGEEPRSGLCRLVYKFSLGSSEGVALTTEKPPKAPPSKYLPSEYENWHDTREKLRAACDGAVYGWVKVGDTIKGYTLQYIDHEWGSKGWITSQVSWLRTDGHRYRFTREEFKPWVCEATNI